MSQRATPAIHASNLGAVCRLAAVLHQRGLIEEASDICERILAAHPDHGDALHLLGVMHHQRNRHEDALELLDRAAPLKRGRADFHRHVGEVYRALRRFNEAVTSFESALAANPDDCESLCNLGHVHLQEGRFTEAAACYRRSLRLDGRDVEALLGMAIVLTHLGDTASAVNHAEQAVAVQHDHVEARHLLASLRGERLKTCAPDYVRDLFDRYALHFDDHLEHKLQYRLPTRMRSVMDSLATPPPDGWRIADLGCGTGLSGKAFADVASYLFGTDLSGEMIARARARAMYDELVQGDLVETLRRCETRFDLLLAADVLLYVGDLTALFRQAARALRPDGWFTLSTEQCQGDSYQIQPSGRFAHSEWYIRGLAEANGFAIIHCSEELLRYDAARPICGQMFALRRDAPT